jgi:hypothetical protein
MILGAVGLLSLMYSNVAVSRFCAVRCLIIICLYLLFYNYSTSLFNILFMFVSFILCFCIVLCFVPPFVSSCLFPLFVQAYRTLTPGENPTAVNKYHIIYTQTLWRSSHWANLHCITDCGFTNCFQFTVAIFQSTNNCVAAVNFSLLAVSRLI